MKKEKMWLIADIGMLLTAIVSGIAIGNYIELESKVPVTWIRVFLYIIYGWFLTKIMSRWYYGNGKPKADTKTD